jgi:hypothetical protein
MLTRGNIFRREKLSSPSDVMRWWFRGLNYLNTFFVLYAVAHLLVTWFVFKNGWIFFLTVPILFVGLLINLIYLLGPLSELLLSHILKVGINFNSFAPDMKRFLFVLFIATTIAFSVYDLARYFH